MSPRQRDVLSAMKDGWQSAGNVTGASGLAYRTVVGCLRRLVEQGYVERGPHGYRYTIKAMRLRVRHEPSLPPRRKQSLRAEPFSKKYADPESPRYGRLFLIARLLRCWLCEEGYEGPGHEVGRCALGQQGGHTAHHLHRFDAEGMIPGGGQTHDLLVGRGGMKAVRHFRSWLEVREGLPWRDAIEVVGQRYVERAKKIAERRRYDDEDLAW